MEKMVKYNGKNKDTIVFDIETNLIPSLKELFDPDIWDYDTARERQKKAIKKLKISVICAYSYKKGNYYFFGPREVKKKLFPLFKNAKIVGYNIKAFDLEVLKRFGLPKNLVIIDLLDLIYEETGNRYSLNRLSKENIGRGKLYKGKDLANMKEVNLYNGCKADVENTKELYNLWLDGKLKYDKYPHKIHGFTDIEVFQGETQPDKKKLEFWEVDGGFTRKSASWEYNQQKTERPFWVIKTDGGLFYKYHSYSKSNSTLFQKIKSAAYRKNSRDNRNDNIRIKRVHLEKQISKCCQTCKEKGLKFKDLLKINNPGQILFATKCKKCKRNILNRDVKDYYLRAGELSFNPTI